MVEEAEDADKVSQSLETDTKVELEDTETDGANAAEGEDRENQETETEEIEVVLEGDAGALPDDKTLEINRLIRKKQAKSKEKIKAANAEKQAIEKELNLEKERNKLLQLRLEQDASEASLPARPKAEDFLDGADDPRFHEALDAYHEARTQQKIDAALKKAVPPEPETRPQESGPDFSQSQARHIERGVKLGLKDFEDVEQAASDILGDEAADFIINTSDESHIVLYYLGKNPSKAQEIRDLVSSKSKLEVIKGVKEIGRLEALLKSVPKARKKPALDPDDENEHSIQSKNSKRGPKGATFT